jgi:hypothetical protein
MYIRMRKTMNELNKDIENVMKKDNWPRLRNRTIYLAAVYLCIYHSHFHNTSYCTSLLISPKINMLSPICKLVITNSLSPAKYTDIYWYMN